MRKLLVNAGQVWDGWDGVGKVAPSENVLKFADIVLDMLQTKRLIPNCIIPSVENGISILFRSNKQSAILEYFNAGDGCLILIESGDEVECFTLTQEKEAGVIVVTQLKDFFHGKQKTTRQTQRVAEQTQTIKQAINRYQKATPSVNWSDFDGYNAKINRGVHNDHRSPISTK